MSYFKTSAKWLGQTVLVIWLVLTLVYAGLHLAGGNPIDLLIDARLSNAQREVLSEKFGYQDPPLVRYARYLANTSKGDFGISFLYKMPVGKVLLPRIIKSMGLGLLALSFALVISLVLLASVQDYQPKWMQKVADACLSVLLTVPAFVWAPLVLAFFARELGWFPSYGSRALFLHDQTWLGTITNKFHHAVLPAFCLSLPLAGQLVAYLNEQSKALRHAPFVLSALGRGITPKRVFWNHQLRQILPSLFQWLGLYIPILAGGAVVIEAVFGWPGLGLVLFDAVMARDYPLLLGGCIWLTLLIVPTYKAADWVQLRRETETV